MRHHELDAARAAAMLLGVFFHAAISFMATPLGWAAYDRSRSEGVDAFTFISHAFRMPVFFLLSGFFSRLLVEKRGLNDFLKQRVKRLGGPLLLFWPPVAASLFYLWRWGRTLPDQPRPAAGGLEVPENIFIFAPAHLWFIYYLLLIALGAWALARVKASGWMDRLRAWTLLPLTAVALLPMRTFEIETPISFVPDVRILGFYALFFLAGWVLHRRPERIPGFGRHLILKTLFAGAVLAAIVPLALKMGPERRLFGMSHVLGCVLMALFTWTLVGLFIGLFVRWMSKERPWVAWLSDASYWVYLVHLPLCVLLQVWIAPLPGWGPLKYAVVALGTLGACLATYPILVRYTWLGSLLNGPRKPLTVAPSPARI